MKDQQIKLPLTESQSEFVQIWSDSILKEEYETLEMVLVAIRCGRSYARYENQENMSEQHFFETIYTLINTAEKEYHDYKKNFTDEESRTLERFMAEIMLF